MPARRRWWRLHGLNAPKIPINSCLDPTGAPAASHLLPPVCKHQPRTGYKERETDLPDEVSVLLGYVPEAAAQAPGSPQSTMALLRPTMLRLREAAVASLCGFGDAVVKNQRAGVRVCVCACVCSRARACALPDSRAGKQRFLVK